MLMLGFLFATNLTVYANSTLPDHSELEAKQKISQIYHLSLENNFQAQCMKSCAVSSRPCFAKLWLRHKERKNAFRMVNWEAICKKEKSICEKKCSREKGNFPN